MHLFPKFSERIISNRNDKLTFSVDKQYPLNLKLLLRNSIANIFNTQFHNTSHDLISKMPELKELTYHDLVIFYGGHVKKIVTIKKHTVNNELKIMQAFKNLLRQLMGWFLPSSKISLTKPP